MKKIFEKKPTFEEMKEVSKKLWKISEWSSDEFTILMPPPNVTGALHIGHALTYSIQDTIVRLQQSLNGRKGFLISGFDHGGISTQISFLKQQTENSDEDQLLSFKEKISKFANNCRRMIKEQMEIFGLLKNDKYEKYTLDEDHTKLVESAFITFYRRGLITRNEAIVNYDLSYKTAVSDLEVEYREEKGFLHYVFYRVLDSNETISVATTRIETIFADVALAVNSKDERYSHLIGKKVIVPICNTIIPIISLDEVDISYGTGVLKITPAHSLVDWDIGQRHNLPAINIIDENGNFFFQFNEFQNATENEIDDLIRKVDEKYNVLFDKNFLINVLIKKTIFEKQNLSMSEMKIKICEILQCEQTEIVHKVPYSSKGGKIEHLLQKQWVFNIKQGAELALNNEINIYPNICENTYKTWLQNIKPWNISRTITWGHRIPAWFKQENTEEKKFEQQEIDSCCIPINDSSTNDLNSKNNFNSQEVYVGMNAPSCESCRINGKSSLCWKCSEIWKYLWVFTVSLFRSRSTDKFVISLLKNILWIAPFYIVYEYFRIKSIENEKKKWTRSNEVLDTWFSSALWPLTYKRSFDLFPTNALVTAYDIIFFWVARMVMVTLLLENKVPFQSVYIHRLVRDKKGMKMSKTMGNVINPIEIIDKYGYDSLRIALLSEVSPISNIRFSEELVEQKSHIITKLWNLFIYLKNFIKEEGETQEWIDSYFDGFLNDIVKKNKEYLEKYEIHLIFENTINGLYEVCDWLVEVNKYEPKTGKTLRESFKKILLLFYPLCPYITTWMWFDLYENSICNFDLTDCEVIDFEKMKEFIEMKQNVKEIRFLKNIGCKFSIKGDDKKINLLKKLCNYNEENNSFENKENYIKKVNIGNFIIEFFEIPFEKLNHKLVKLQNKSKEINNFLNSIDLTKVPENIMNEKKTELSQLKEEIEKMNLICNLE